MQLSFIGAGKMATAVACGLIRQKVFSPSQLRASDISATARAAFAEETGSECLNDNAAAVAAGETVILAVKPQDAGKALEPLTGTFGGKLLISIAAGLKPLVRICVTSRTFNRSSTRPISFNSP